MRVTAACIGRAGASPEQELCDAYLARARALGPALGFSKIALRMAETSRAATPAARMDQEAGRLRKLIPEGAFWIALDERGAALSSEKLARKLAGLRDDGMRDVVFLIGGPDGLAANLRKEAGMRLSFGALTWPHLLMRVMLAEQIYRCLTILSGHPYHRAASAP